MKTSIYISLVIITLTIVFRPGSASATDTLPSNSYTVPAELVLSSDSVTVDDFFFPIGWSKKGLFAFAAIGSLEGNDKYSVTYVVYSMATDSCLWRYDDFGEYPEPHTAALKASWVQQQKKLNTALSGYGIVNRAIGNFTLFPFKYADDSVYSELKLLRENKCAGNLIVESNLYIRTTKNGSKRVAHQLYGCDAPGFSERPAGAPAAMFVIGALISPFEPRVVSITGVTPAYGESPTTTYKLNGAHLSNGFSRK